MIDLAHRFFCWLGWHVPIVKSIRARPEGLIYLCECERCGCRFQR